MPDIVVNKQKGDEIARAQNEAYFPPVIAEVQQDFGIKSVPIYIFNVAPLEHNSPRPPNHPHLFIRACPKNKPYILVGQIEHPFREVSRDQNGNQKVNLTDGYREATKMLNPMNPGTDQNFAEEGFMAGGNLNNYGVFWSKHNPPLDEEVSAARKRMERKFGESLDLMMKIEAEEGAAALPGRVDRVAHAAADYFGRTFSWHQRFVPDTKPNQVACQACGESISAVARICKECGAPTDPAKLDVWLTERFNTKPVAAR